MQINLKHYLESKIASNVIIPLPEQIPLPSGSFLDSLKSIPTEKKCTGEKKASVQYWMLAFEGGSFYNNLHSIYFINFLAAVNIFQQNNYLISRTVIL